MKAFLLCTHGHTHGHSVVKMFIFRFQIGTKVLSRQILGLLIAVRTLLN